MIAWLLPPLAVGPFLLGLANFFQFRTPEPAENRPGVSVLIPARNEEANIAAAVACALASAAVTLEVIVLDDASTDRTPEILAGISDGRLRVERAPVLPPGWCGKQHACAALAALARYDLMVFVDADVRLAPDALARMAGFMQRNAVGLASGFPRQIVGSWSERLILPMMLFLLLGFLPMGRMRRSPAPALGAGCGQLFIARRGAYARAGGHAAILASRHDGLTLPRAFRRAGEMTGLFDATSFAQCRMYAGAAQLWEGLDKNATEGMARPVALPVWTVLLGGGQVAPFLCLAFAPHAPAVIAAAAALGFRFALAVRFRQPWSSALLHPLGVLALLTIQYVSLARRMCGRPATWRGRAYSA